MNRCRLARRLRLLRIVVLGALVAGGDARGGAQPAATMADVRRALDRGLYAQAAPMAVDLCARVKELSGAQSVEFARAEDLLVEARLRNGEAAASATLALAEGVVRLKEQLAGADNLETAGSLHNLGAVHLERGESAAALAAHQRALSIRSRHLPSDAPAIADSLDHVVRALIPGERFDEGRRLLARALPIRESAAATAPLGLAETLELSARLDRYAFQAGTAAPPLNRALEIRQRFSPEHPDLARLNELRGDVLFLRSDIGGARSAWRDALALDERTLRPGHPALASVERRLAVAAKAFGERVEERRLLESALRIGEQSMAPCHPEFLPMLGDLASAVAYDGEYAEAVQALSARVDEPREMPGRSTLADGHRRLQRSEPGRQDE